MASEHTPPIDDSQNNDEDTSSTCFFPFYLKLSLTQHWLWFTRKAPSAALEECTTHESTGSPVKCQTGIQYVQDYSGSPNEVLQKEASQTTLPHRLYEDGECLLGANNQPQDDGARPDAREQPTIPQHCERVKTLVTSHRQGIRMREQSIDEDASVTAFCKGISLEGGKFYRFQLPSCDFTLESNNPDEPWRVGEVLLLGELGSGANGTVYRAQRYHDQATSKQPEDLAVKVIDKAALLKKKSPFATLQSLEREVKILGLANHKNVAKLHTMLHGRDRLYIGMTLGWMDVQAFSETQGASVDLLHPVVTGVLLALEHLHAEVGCGHLDVKPENILLKGPPPFTSRSALLCDLGHARFVGRNNGSLPGTLGFLAPELAMGTTNWPACDMWSLGTCLLEFCRGLSDSWMQVYGQVTSSRKQFIKKLESCLKSEADCRWQYDMEKKWVAMDQSLHRLIFQNLLVPSSRRLSANEALRNDWILSRDQTKPPALLVPLESSE